MYMYIQFLEHISYEKCSQDLFDMSRPFFFYFNNIPIHSRIHRIRIRYSKCQSILQNTPTMPKLIKSKKNEKIKQIHFSNISISK